MSLKIYQSDPYRQTHEREQFESFSNICKECFAKTAEPNILFGNICLNGAELDALLIKPDAIIIIEFKNYGGHVTATENGDWMLNDETVIKGGNGRNPFLQTRHNRYEGVMPAFNNRFPRDYVNLGHVAGVVVFNQDAEIDDSAISSRIRSWFHVVDMKHVASKIRNITSPEIHYNYIDMEEIPSAFGFDDMRDLIYPNIDDIVDKIDEECEILEIDDTEDRPPKIRTKFIFQKTDPSMEFNGGNYRGDWDWETMKPNGKGILEKGDMIYTGTWIQGSPLENAEFIIKSVDDDFTFKGKLNPNMKPAEGYMITESEGVKREYDGTFDRWRLQKGTYKKNGTLRSIGTFKYTSQHDGALHMELIEGRQSEENFGLGEGCKYTGFIDVQTKLPEDNCGELIDANGNRFVGPFVNGKKNGCFEVYLSGEQNPRQCNYKDDVEI